MAGEFAHGAGFVLAYWRAYLRRALEYRAHLLIGGFAMLSRHTVSLLTLWVLFSQTKALGDWQPYQVLYLYGYVSLIVAFWHLCFANTLRMEFLVRDAELDRYLVRPLPPMFQMLFYYFDDDAIGDFIPAIACLVVASMRLNVEYTWQTSAIFVLGIIGGVLVHFGIHLLLSAWSFWFIKSRALIMLFMEVRRFSEYPMTVYPVALQLAFTVVLPIAFSGFYPVQRLLSVQTLSAAAWLSLPVGLLVCGLGITAWNAGLAKYQSAGS